MKKGDIVSIVGAPFETASAVVYGAPCEQTASGHEGMGAGPQAVADILREDIELYDRFLNAEPLVGNGFGFKMLQELADLSPEEMTARLKATLESEQRFYVLVGGVHSVSIGSLQALATKVNPKDVTILHIDAHYDLRNDDSEYTDTPSSFAHSAAMRRGHELGFNLVSVGIRTMAQEEVDYVQEHQNITTFEWGRELMLGADNRPLPTIDQVLSSIKTDKVYLSIDVDGFDPAVMPGTGTPVPGGLTYQYGNALIRAVMRQKHVLAADIVEIAPQEDTYITEYGAAQLVFEMLALSQIQR